MFRTTISSSQSAQFVVRWTRIRCRCYWNTINTGDSCDRCTQTFRSCWVTETHKPQNDNGGKTTKMYSWAIYSSLMGQNVFDDATIVQCALCGFAAQRDHPKTAKQLAKNIFDFIKNRTVETKSEWKRQTSKKKHDKHIEQSRGATIAIEVVTRFSLSFLLFFFVLVFVLSSRDDNHFQVLIKNLTHCFGRWEAIDHCETRANEIKQRKNC